MQNKIEKSNVRKSKWCFTKDEYAEYYKVYNTKEEAIREGRKHFAGSSIKYFLVSEVRQEEIDFGIFDGVEIEEELLDRNIECFGEDGLQLFEEDKERLLEDRLANVLRTWFYENHCDKYVLYNEIITTEKVRVKPSLVERLAKFFKDVDHEL